MLKNSTKILSIILCASLGLATLSGCSKKETVNSQSELGKNITYPIKTDVTLTYWLALSPNVSASSKSMGETEFAKELENKTGIKVKWLHPAQGQEKEQFNLLLASGDLPDIIEWNWNIFAGGPEKAINDGYIVNLKDNLNKFAPNLTKYLSENPDVKKLVSTDSGAILSFPFVRGDDILTISNGPILRNDWLKELNLQVPTTIDEWTTVLTAFKDKKGATAPLSPMVNELNFGAFSGAYGVIKGYYTDNGKVKYGPLEPGFKDYVANMAKWYKDGLLDKNFATVDTKIKAANMTGSKSGAAIGYNGSELGAWINAMKDKNPSFDLVGAPYPVLKKGDKPQFSQKSLVFDGIGAAINAKSKNIELAARLLDYGYSKEGQNLYNFGTENVSYKNENGYPKYTDAVMKNTDKLSIAQAIGKFARSSYSGPFVQRKEYIEQLYTLPQQQTALKNWSDTDMAKHIVPGITPTPNEATELAKIDNEVGTYVDEMFLKFIMGIEPLTNYDKFIDQVKKLNIDKALKIKQDALDRFNKR